MSKGGRSNSVRTCLTTAQQQSAGLPHPVPVYRHRCTLLGTHPCVNHTRNSACPP